MAFKKINPFSRTNPDTGFGSKASDIGGRFVNKDGSFNLRKEGIPFYRRMSVYSNLLAFSLGRFILVIISFYILINLAFSFLYYLAGYNQLQGMLATTSWGRMKELFFFSTETFTTVGYGRINPIGDTAHLIAAFESMTGFLSFAVATGLIYGRFAKPRAFLKFSDQALIAPYKEGIGLMFRMVPYKSKHHLTNAHVVVSLAMQITDGGVSEFKFYQLNLERSRIDTLNMNWTVVHPINEESPLLNFSEEDLENSDLELYVLVTGFDQVFSNTVMQRTSYTYKEMVWGGRFKPMYHESADGNTTIIEIDKLNHFEKVELNVPVVQ